MSHLELDEKFISNTIKVNNNFHPAFSMGIHLAIFASNFSKNNEQNDRIKEIKSRPAKSCRV